jgi:TATA-box binding protein (TBP) (component of TFIID and TFIIIB)
MLSFLDVMKDISDTLAEANAEEVVKIHNFVCSRKIVSVLGNDCYEKIDERKNEKELPPFPWLMNFTGREKDLLNYALIFLSCNLDDGDVEHLTGADTTRDCKNDYEALNSEIKKLIERFQ